MSSNDTSSLLQIGRQAGASEDAEPLDLGARVRELRKSHGWTLEQAAVRAGLARSTLSKIENGQMSPTFDAVNWPKDQISVTSFRLRGDQVTGAWRSRRRAKVIRCGDLRT